MQISDTYWVQNLGTDISVFKSDNGKFRLEGHGYAGSIVEVDRKIAFDPFIRRAEQRGKIRFLEQAEALELMSGLSIKEHQDSNKRILESLDEGASERVGRYSRDDLPEEAEARAPISYKETWAKHGTAQQDDGPKRVTRSAPAEDVEVGRPSAVLTERVREGEWEPDLG